MDDMIMGFTKVFIVCMLFSGYVVAGEQVALNSQNIHVLEQKNVPEPAKLKKELPNLQTSGMTGGGESASAIAIPQSASAIAIPQSASAIAIPQSASGEAESESNNPSATMSSLTPEQEIRVGELTKNYLLAHPEVLIEVSQKLEVQQRQQQLKAMTEAVLQYQQELLNDDSSPSYGMADAKVALVEFFDYQCIVCAQQAPVIESLIKENPQVRFVFKEWPIFSPRWDASLYAAETGVQLWRQRGAEAYLTYHNALYATGHNEGKLTREDISKAASQAGMLSTKKGGEREVLLRNDSLAQKLGLRGTPGLIVMPVSGATSDNVTVMLGGTKQDALQNAIDKALGSTK